MIQRSGGIGGFEGPLRGQPLVQRPVQVPGRPAMPRKPMPAGGGRPRLVGDGIAGIFPRNPGENFSQRRRFAPLIPRQPPGGGGQIDPGFNMRGDVMGGQAPGGWGNFFPQEPMPAPQPYPGGDVMPGPAPGGFGGFEGPLPGNGYFPPQLPGYLPGEGSYQPMPYPGGGGYQPSPGWGGFEGSLPQAPNPWQNFLQQLLASRGGWRM
jgi:hypothetical protein